MSIDLSLDRISVLLDHFTQPYVRPTVHIAGTNGKGSVAAFLSSLFKAAGLTVGRFTSPHLRVPHDSITIDGSAISDQDYYRAKDAIMALAAQCDTQPTEFEALTIAALHTFEQKSVDVVICEVGLGGRLDATNVMPTPCIIASVITAISLDHTALLGSKPEQIAREKAGIIRPETPIIVAEQQFSEVISVIAEVAAINNAPLIEGSAAKPRPWDSILDGPQLPPFSLYPSFLPPPPSPVCVRVMPTNETFKLLLALPGDHQHSNLGTALTVFSILRRAAPGDQQCTLRRHMHTRISSLTPESIHRAIRTCAWPGRLSFLEYRSGDNTSNLPILVDGAHNHASAHALGNYVKTLLTRLVQSAALEHSLIHLRLTYILALSHSPPKTTDEVLEPILQPLFAQKKSETEASMFRISPQIAVIGFTPVPTMPWVRAVPLDDLKASVERILGSRGLRAATAADGLGWPVQALRSDGRFDSLVKDGLNAELLQALEWASRPHNDGPTTGEEMESRNSKTIDLAIVAGSLYLVSDLYRLPPFQTMATS